METDGMPMSMDLSIHASGRRSSLSHSTPSLAGSPPPGPTLPLSFLPVPTWHAGTVAMYDLHISLRQRRLGAYFRPSSANVAQLRCCDTLGAKANAGHRGSMPLSEGTSLSLPANAAAANPKMTRSMIRRTSQRRRTGRGKRKSNSEERMRVGVRQQWEYEKDSTIRVTEVPDFAAEEAMETSASVPDANSPPVSRVATVEGVDEDRAPQPSHLLRRKPKVLIIATGGTIAGKGSSPTQSAGYESGVICVEDLVEAVPNLKDVADISTHQACEVGSPDLASETLIELAQLTQRQLERDDLDAIVITHGTDTLEETSFFLDLTVFSSKPVVVTGAMLPSTSLSADGPKNLFEAVCVGVSPASRERGVLVVFNGCIMPARFTVKSDANMIQTFEAGHQGSLGQLVDDTILYYWPPARPIGHRHIDIMSLDPKNGLPRIGVEYGFLGGEVNFERHARGGVQGLVLAAMGAGCWSNQGKEQLNRHIGPGRPGHEGESEPAIPVVTSFRTVRGCVSLKKDIFGVPDWVIRAGFLNPAKSIKLLQVCLAVGMSYQEIKEAFSMDTNGS